MLSPDQVYPVSNSRLTAFRRSPLHLIHYLTKPQTSTPAMEFGKAFHMALLQPELFGTSYLISPDIDRRSKAGKDAWAEFMAVANGTPTVTIDEYNRIQDMVDAVMNNSSAADLISNLVAKEQDVRWHDDVYGIPMRGIIDGIGPEYLIDVKTCVDASPDKFQRDAINMAYHRQAALYVDSQSKPVPFYLIAIEKDEPYGVSVHEVSESLIMAGRVTYRHLLNELQGWVEDGCQATGYEFWHFTGIHNFDTPNWMKTT